MKGKGFRCVFGCHVWIERKETYGPDWSRRTDVWSTCGECGKRTEKVSTVRYLNGEAIESRTAKVGWLTLLLSRT